MPKASIKKVAVMKKTRPWFSLRSMTCAICGSGLKAKYRLVVATLTVVDVVVTVAVVVVVAVDFVVAVVVEADIF
jgi:hypothetical protein